MPTPHDSPHDCPLINHEAFIANMEKKEWRLGPFSSGDLIAIAGIIFMSGALWVQTLRNGEDIRTMQVTDAALQSRVNSVELTIPSNYVLRSEYRDDTKEIKSALLRIEQKVDEKADKHAK